MNKKDLPVKVLRSDGSLTATDAQTGEIVKLSFGIAFPYIKSDKTKNMWDNIDDMVSSYKDLYKEDFKLFVTQTKEIRETRENQYAGSKKDSLRWGLSIPLELGLAIKKHFPEALEKNNQKIFMRRYPEFRICDVI